MATNEKQMAIVSALCLDEDGGAAATFRRFVELGVRGDMFTDPTPSAVWAAAKRLEATRPGAWSKLDLQDAMTDHPSVVVSLLDASTTSAIYPHLIPQYAKDLIADFHNREVLEMAGGVRERIARGEDATSLLKQMQETYRLGGSGGVVRLPSGLLLSREQVKGYDALGDTENANETCTHPRPLPPYLVNGLIRKQEFGTVTGASKTRKSWFLMYLAFAIAFLKAFFGIKVLTPVDVLYLNFELLPGAWDERLALIRSAWGNLSETPHVLRAWQLRGKTLNYKDLSAAIQYRLWKEKWKDPPGLIIIDPAYKTWTGADELSSGIMAEVYDAFGKLVEDLGAAVVACLHSTKGKQDGKRALDTSSGAGVQGRMPDFNTNLRVKDSDLTNNNPAPKITVEPTLRHGEAVKSFKIVCDLEGKKVLVPAIDDSDDESGEIWSQDCWLPAFPNEDEKLRAKDLTDFYTAHSVNKSQSSAENALAAAVKAHNALLGKSGKSKATRYYLTPEGVKEWRKLHEVDGAGLLEPLAESPVVEPSPDDEF